MADPQLFQVESEEPLVFLSSGTAPRVPYYSPDDFGTHNVQQRSIPTYSSSFPISPSESTNITELERMREMSLMDFEDVDSENPLLQAQLHVSQSKLSSNDSLRPGDSKSDSFTVSTRPRSPGPSRSPRPMNRRRNDFQSSPSRRSCEWCMELGTERFLCILCTTTMCPTCWDKLPAHKHNKLGLGGIPHEKTDHEVAQTINDTLDRKRSEIEDIELHTMDENSAWFGVLKDGIGDLIFQDSGRYASVMAECSSSRRGTRFPSLVSFVGAGKSSLVKMLIDVRKQNKRVAVPVVGAAGRNVPTSGDVHLYADPESSTLDHPLLYVDCEGLEGGERDPFAATVKSRNRNANQDHNAKKRTDSFTKRLRKRHHSSQREICWASPEKSSRQFLVTNLYPRVLYTFSDVVVFVLKEEKTIEKVVERLVDWAHAAIEKSTNQPVLPQVVIVLNASENSLDLDEWEVDFATAKLLSSIGHALSQPILKEYARKRSTAAREIRSPEDLLFSYYGSVRVVRIPTRGRPQLIKNQIDKLYQEISQLCELSRMKKREVRMLFDADELQPFLQLAFDHYAQTLDTPFDFVKAYLMQNPIPADFGGNITKLAIKMMQHWENKLDAEGIFRELSPMVASCIMLDAARHKIKGSAENILRGHYIQHCDDALEDFCDRHWPCEYSSKDGRCVNVRSGHSAKGHQLQNGKTFGSSQYVAYWSRFSAEAYGNIWKSSIHQYLEVLIQTLKEASSDMEAEEVTASKIHQECILTPLFRHNGSSESYVSHSTCFSCLMAPAEHSIPCGHIFCTPCMKVYGTMRGKSRVDLMQCPLWHSEKKQWNPPWPINLKPASAGIRILTLDGGGVRGIAELEILGFIQKALGPHVSLRSMFDLIVGTSAGGIIALGLGVEGWSVTECMDKFKSLCRPSFTPRKFYGIPGLGALVEAHHHSKYETKPLEEALMGTFSHGNLFGGHKLGDQHTTKVAVVATRAAGLKAVVLSNYNRTGEDDKLDYHFQRPDDPTPEIGIWEAARATSAAPTYYKSFSHGPSKEEYYDGGLRYNNPIAIANSERKLIWPDMAKSLPDLLFSIGSGYCPDSKVQKRTTKDAEKLGMVSNIKSLYRLAVDHIESSLDSEAAWQKYIEILAPPEDQMDRFRRFNVELKDGPPPKLDDVNSMYGLSEATKRAWWHNGRIQDAAHHLVATCFYLEKDKLDQLDNDTFECTGHIQCRFPNGTQEMHGLGRLLKGNHVQRNGGLSSRTLYFIVREKLLEPLAQQIPIGNDVIEGMIHDGRFQMGQIKFPINHKGSSTEILLSLANDKWFPISGFPRQIPQEDEKSAFQPLGSRANRQRTPSQLQRRDKWAGPQRAEATTQGGDTNSKYSSPGYIVRNSTSEFLSEISKKFSRNPPAIPQTLAELSNPSTIFELPAEELSGPYTKETHRHSWT